MNGGPHAHPLGAYVLGAVDDGERREIEQHLAGCAECRAEAAGFEEVRDMLDEVPPEAFLEGRPDADHVLARTLDDMRASERTGAFRRRAFALAAGIVLVTSVAAGGVAAGRATAPEAAALPPPVPTATVPAPVEGTRTGTTVDGTTGARLTASVVPADGWVRVTTAVSGIPQGEHCRIMVVRKDGTSEAAGGWVVSAKGAANGSTLDGTAIVAPADVAAVQIVNTDGKVFVSLPFA